MITLNDIKIRKGIIFSKINLIFLHKYDCHITKCHNLSFHRQPITGTKPYKYGCQCIKFGSDLSMMP